ncbi:hypothetical protein STENM327S_07675 [Streptomyces tendae]
MDGDLGRVRLGHGHRHVGVRTGRQGVGRVPGGGAQTGHLQPQPGEPMLERLEAADLSVELLAFLEVADRLGQQPVGETQLLGGEQPGTGREGPAHGGFRVPEAAPGGPRRGPPAPVAGWRRATPGSDGHAGGADRVQPPSSAGTSSTSASRGRRRCRSTPVQRARSRRTRRRPVPARRDVQSDRERGAVVGPDASSPSRSSAPAGRASPRWRRRRSSGTARGATAAAQLLQDHGSFAVGGTLPAQFLRDQQAREAHASRRGPSTARRRAGRPTRCGR